MLPHLVPLYHTFEPCCKQAFPAKMPYACRKTNPCCKQAFLVSTYHPPALCSQEVIHLRGSRSRLGTEYLPRKLHRGAALNSWRQEGGLLSLPQNTRPRHKRPTAAAPFQTRTSPQCCPMHWPRLAQLLERTSWQLPSSSIPHHHGRPVSSTGKSQ